MGFAPISARKSKQFRPEITQSVILFNLHPRATGSTFEYHLSVTLTYAVHAAQAREGSSRHLLDAVFMDP